MNFNSQALSLLSFGFHSLLQRAFFHFFLSILLSLLSFFLPLFFSLLSPLLSLPFYSVEKCLPFISLRFQTFFLSLSLAWKQDLSSSPLFTLEVNVLLCNFLPSLSFHPSFSLTQASTSFILSSRECVYCFVLGSKQASKVKQRKLKERRT